MNNTQALKNKGLVLYLLSKYEEAIKCFDKALDLDANFALALYGKAECLVSLVKLKFAIECCK
jgi:tetratricopeptide (TPR) repeat protein